MRRQKLLRSAVLSKETGSGWASRHYDWTNLNNYAFVSPSIAVAGTLKAMFHNTK